MHFFFFDGGGGGGVSVTNSFLTTFFYKLFSTNVGVVDRDFCGFSCSTVWKGDNISYDLLTKCIVYEADKLNLMSLINILKKY